MVLALVGDSTTTTSMGRAAPSGSAGRAIPAGPRSFRPVVPGSARAQADAVAGLTVDAARQLQLEQRGLHSGAAASHSRISSSTASGTGPSAARTPVGQGCPVLHGRSRRRRGRRSRQTNRANRGRPIAGSQRRRGPPGRRRHSPPDAPRRGGDGWCRDGAGPGGCPAPPSPRGHSRGRGAR